MLCSWRKISSLEVDSGIWVQILNETDFIVGLTRFFNFGMANSLGEGKQNSNQL